MLAVLPLFCSLLGVYPGAGWRQAGCAEPESANRQLRPGGRLQACGATRRAAAPAGLLSPPGQANLEQGQQRGLPGAGEQICTATEVGVPAEGFPNSGAEGKSLSPPNTSSVLPPQLLLDVNAAMASSDIEWHDQS